jgi:2-hydroxy-3-keto-5-methylthiopentenyl-1-phosphate phosphatase
MRKVLKQSGAAHPKMAPIIFSDFDGTITQADVTDEILTQLAHPSWREIEQEWVLGLIGSRECMERQMALVETSPAELHALVDAIPIDPHFPALYKFIQKQKLPFYVVSDAFDYVIRRVLKRIGVNGPLRNGTHLFSSALRVEGHRLIPSFPGKPCAHGCATCKAAVIRRFGAGRQPIIFVGDGLSDRFAIEESDVIFAKHQLLSYCREHKIECHPFETFAEVHESIEKLLEPIRAEGRARKDQKSRVERESKTRNLKSGVLAFDF